MWNKNKKSEGKKNQEQVKPYFDGNSDDAEVQEAAERKAFSLVDPDADVKFGEEQFNEFREAFALVSHSGVQRDLIEQLLLKIGFNLKERSHNLNKKGLVRTASLVNEFWASKVLNKKVDEISSQFNTYNDLTHLICYLQVTLKNLCKDLIRQRTTLETTVSNDENDPVLDVPINDAGEAQVELKDTQEVVRIVIKDFCLEKYRNGSECYALVNAHCFEGKTFPEIAQEFKTLFPGTKPLTVSAYNKRFNKILNDLKEAGKLKELVEVFESIRQQLDSTAKALRDQVNSSVDPKIKSKQKSKGKQKSEGKQKSKGDRKPNDDTSSKLEFDADSESELK